MLWWRFQQCLGMFGILLVEASPETGLFWHLSDYIFGVRNFENTKGMRVIFCWKHSKFQLHFKKAAKNWEKCFCFWDNRIWINIIILSLLTRGYLWSGANVLKRSPKIKETFSKSIILTMINKYDKGAVMQISTVFRPVYHVPCGRLLWNGTF